MKTIKTKVLVTAFMLGTLFSYSKNTNFNNISNTKKVRVVFEETKKGHHLIIKDNEGIILHSEDVKKEGKLIKIFDFSKLKNGKYSLELEKDFEIIIKSIEIKNNQIIFDENSKKVIFKPVIRNEKNKLMVSKIAFDKEPLQVILYYNDNVIYSETLENDTVLNRVYKLDKQEKGEYRIVAYNNGRTYSKTFKI